MRENLNICETLHEITKKAGRKALKYQIHV